MKKTLFAFAVLLNAPFQAFSAFSTVTNTNLIDINIESPKVTVAVNYPGADIANVCGVEIRSDSYNRDIPISKFFNVIEFKEAIGVVPSSSVLDSTTILVDVRNYEGMFGAWFDIATKDGSTLAQAIKQSLGPDRQVVLVARTCH